METIVTMHTHQTAPTQFVQANEIRFAYRCFGKGEDARRCRYGPSEEPSHD
jgi:hypothetical protein